MEAFPSLDGGFSSAELGHLQELLESTAGAVPEPETAPDTGQGAAADAAASQETASGGAAEEAEQATAPPPPRVSGKLFACLTPWDIQQTFPAAADCEAADAAAQTGQGTVDDPAVAEVVLEEEEQTQSQTQTQGGGRKKAKKAEKPMIPTPLLRLLRSSGAGTGNPILKSALEERDEKSFAQVYTTRKEVGGKRRFDSQVPILPKPSFLPSRSPSRSP